jgi:hypothetical protein
MPHAPKRLRNQPTVRGKSVRAHRNADRSAPSSPDARAEPTIGGDGNRWGVAPLLVAYWAATLPGVPLRIPLRSSSAVAPRPTQIEAQSMHPQKY